MEDEQEGENSETVSSSSQLSTSFYTPSLRTLRRHRGWCSYNDLSTFDPPRAASPSQVFRNVVNNLESVERLFDLDGTDVYMNERSLHILYLLLCDILSIFNGNMKIRIDRKCCQRHSTHSSTLHCHFFNSSVFVVKHVDIGFRDVEPFEQYVEELYVDLDRIAKEDEKDGFPSRDYMACLYDIKEKIRFFKYDSLGNMYTEPPRLLKNIGVIIDPIATKRSNINALISLLYEVFYGMILYGYRQSLSAFSSATSSRKRRPYFSSPEKFGDAMALAISADSDATQAVAIRHTGNKDEANRVAGKASSCIQQSLQVLQIPEREEVRHFSPILEVDDLPCGDSQRRADRGLN